MILGFAIAIPPTALVTETAGVNTPSAIVKLKVMNTRTTCSREDDV